MAAFRMTLHAVFLITLCNANDEHDFVHVLARIKELEEGQTLCMQYVPMISDLQARLNQAESRLLELGDLDSKLQEANARIHDLEIKLKIDKPEADKDETSNELPKQSTTKSQEEVNDTPYVKDVDNTTHRIQSYRRGADARARSATPNTDRVAFSAYVNNGISNLGANHIIHFDTIIHNEGSGFDPLLGIFTCPVSGTYYFQTTILSMKEDFIDTSIVLDENWIAAVHSNAGGLLFGQGTNAAITHCAVGQRVWVRTVDDQEGTKNVYGNRYSTFIGHLLWVDHAR
ncbi:hypothetical protein ACJMK2_007603 [Sinanodonta woodiana]|uniref:C1q domain-containing protein n=1 Tax=Sinanodonta woodiana TaxID=1069815 RepID=A0ABD3VM09_SINWO